MVLGIEIFKISQQEKTNQSGLPRDRHHLQTIPQEVNNIYIEFFYVNSVYAKQNKK